jgi:uncharacterized membrane-anchored protein YitT (DUF2179 family)
VNNTITIRSISILIFANILLAFGTTFFLAPLNIVNGGLSGIAIIFKELWQWDLDVTTAILAWVLFALGWVTLGKSFSLKTFLATITYPLFVFVFIRFLGVDLLGFEVDNDVHRLLASLFGGSLVGLGVALAFLAGGSTGGVDVIILLLKKWFDVGTSQSAFVLDVIIIGFGMLVFGLINGLYGVLSTVMSSVVIELVFVGGSKMYWVTIISKQAKTIQTFIHDSLERGSTIVHAVGGFSQKPFEMIQVAIHRQDYYALKEHISRIDPKAFVIFSQARAIHGEGFDPFPGFPTKQPRKKNKTHGNV